jgi:hypothetical protein
MVVAPGEVIVLIGDPLGLDRAEASVAAENALDFIYQPLSSR